jgi:2-dehydro-3-deoxygalactonokinase
MPEPSFVAVDWGTSSFRLWLMGRNGDVLATSRGADGMLSAQQTGFPDVLSRHLAAVSAPDHLPVIICGMAGARGGWIETGYVDTPARLDGIASGAKRVPGQARDIRILPGLAQRDRAEPDVMRGEETQLLGALSTMQSHAALVCMPGTHSKWVTLQGGIVSGFATYMTGELFDVISHHSILSAAVKDANALDAGNPVFADAIRAVALHPASVTSQLFRARSGQILNGLSATDAVAHLSGTLIGAEIAGATRSLETGGTVCLVATGRLAALYEQAFQTLGIPSQTVDADDAVRQGLTLAAETLWPDLATSSE